MVQFNGIKPLSGRLIAAGAALVFIISGTSYFGGENALSYARAVIMLMLGAVLLVELGLKKFTPISNLRDLGFVQYITLSLGGVLFLGGILALPFIPFNASDGILALTDFVIAAGSVFIVVEAWS